MTDLLLALAKLKSNHWRCLIVGDGQKSKLEDISRELGIQHQVDFFGNQSFEKAMGILKACDIIVNPSYTEGIPTSIIEAALCRKAIIATDGCRRHERNHYRKMMDFLFHQDILKFYSKNSKYSWKTNTSETDSPKQLFSLFMKSFRGIGLKSMNTSKFSLLSLPIKKINFYFFSIHFSLLVH